MAPLTLPHSIDAGTAATANEVQSNFVAIRDAINGDLEGGTGNNLKANGVTARELADALLLYGVPTNRTREGLANSVSELAVTPGAGLVLNVAAGVAWVRDDSGVLSTGALIPASYAGGTVTVPANSSGNPRADRIIYTMSAYGTGTPSVLQGTPNAAATIDNMTGAAAVPNDAIELARVITTNGFAGPYVNHTSLRNIAPWSKPMQVTVTAGSSSVDIAVDSTVDEMVILDYVLEISTNASMWVRPQANSGAVYSVVINESQVLTTGALSQHSRGNISSATGIYLGLPGNAVAGAGVNSYQGRSMIGLGSYGGTRVYNGHFISQNQAGSGNHRASTMAAAGTHAFTTPVSYIRVMSETGTFGGRLYVERVPVTV